MTKDTLEKEYLGRSLTEDDIQKLPSNFRVVENGRAYTLEYRMGRVNLTIDRNNIVTRIWMG